MSKTKYIETPEKLWQLFCDYKDTVKANPRYKMVFVGKDGDQKKEELERPLTMEGFENYVADIPGMPMDLDQYFANTGDSYKDYSSICSRIRKAIRQDQIEGGMVGQYNPSITQRLNGLIDKTETTIKEQPLFPDVPKDDSGQ